MNISIFPHAPFHGRRRSSMTEFSLHPRSDTTFCLLSPHPTSNTSYSTLPISVTYIPTNWGTTASPARLQPTRTADPGCTSPWVEAGTSDRSRLGPTRVAFRGDRRIRGIVFDDKRGRSAQLGVLRRLGRRRLWRLYWA